MENEIEKEPQRRLNLNVDQELFDQIHVVAATFVQNPTAWARDVLQDEVLRAISKDPELMKRTAARIREANARRARVDAAKKKAPKLSL